MVEAYFKELKKYSLSEIARRLNENNMSKLRKALKDQIYINEERGAYSFNYVGVMVVGNYVFRCFPKYIDDVIDDKLEEKFKLLLRVIKKAIKETPKLDLGNIDTDGYNFLRLAISIIEDYYAYGLYTNSREYIEEDGDGEVLWDETPLYNTPIYIKGSYIYDSVLTLDIDIDESDFVQDIHKVVLSECTKKLEDDDLIDLFNIPSAFLTDKRIKDVGAPDIIISRLYKELNNQFNSQKQSIIKNLIKYIENEYLNADIGVSGNIPHSYYGVELFWAVWEEVCKRVFDGDILRTLEEIPLNMEFKSTQEYRDNSARKLAELIDKPIWVKDDAEGGETKELRAESDTYKPDLICIYKKDPASDDDSMSNYVFAILDAKYYYFDIESSDEGNYINAKFTSDGNHPGLEDITKQYIYQQAYKKFVEVQEYGDFYNAFLCPIDGDTYKFGKVRFDLIQKMISPNLKDIFVIRVNAEEIFRAYLSKKKITDISRYLMFE